MIKELLEMDGEFIPHKKGTPDRLARDLLKASKGDPEVATKMAHNFLNFLLASIDEQGKHMGMKDAGGGRPEQSYRQQKPAAGYEQTQGRAQRSYGQA